MPLNLRTILLTIAVISLLGIIAESIRRKIARKKIAAFHDRQLVAQTDVGDCDGIIGEARVVKSAESMLDKPQRAMQQKIDVEQQDPLFVEPEETTTPYLQNASQNDLIVFYIMPKAGQKINGRDLKECLQKLGFEYSSMQIFNYYDTSNNFKELQFCIASAFEPGTFDKQRMIVESFNGLCCFMSAKHRRPEKAFTNMLVNLEQIVKGLQAELCNDHRQPCNNAYIEQCRQRIVD